MNSATNTPPGYVRTNQEELKRRYAHLGLGERVLVRRWGAHGDLVMLTPALRALRAEKPLAQIHVNCHDHAGKVLHGLPYVDAVLTQVPTFIQYTRTINLNGVYEDGQPKGIFKHPALAFCDAAQVAYDGKPYDFVVSEEPQKWAQELLHPYRGRKLVACGLRSANRPKQNWRTAKWLELADSLPEDILLVALDHERRPFFDPKGATPEAEQFFDHPKVLDLTGQTTSLQYAAAVMAGCHAFAGVDSGLLHIANAVGLPTVNLCAAAPEQARTPVAGLTMAFEGKADCFPCQFPDSCPFDTHCLDWVQPQLVFSTLLKWLIESPLQLSAASPV